MIDLLHYNYDNVGKIILMNEKTRIYMDRDLLFLSLFVMSFSHTFCVNVCLEMFRGMD